MAKLGNYLYILICIALSVLSIILLSFDFQLNDFKLLEYSVSSIFQYTFLETKNAYFLVHLLVIVFPLILSFDKKVGFYKKWPKVILSSIIVAIPFLLNDILFTKLQIWGFNESYISGLRIYNLPVEEVLFFFTVPFSCIFIFECLLSYFPKLNIIAKPRKLLILLAAFLLGISILSLGSVYTLTFALLSLLLVLIELWTTSNHVVVKLIAFAISLIPFLLVNGILTGIATEAPIVVYNDAEHSLDRIISIPTTDILYAFVHLNLVWSVYLGIRA